MTIGEGRVSSRPPTVPVTGSGMGVRRPQGPPAVNWCAAAVRCGSGERSQGTAGFGDA